MRFKIHYSIEDYDDSFVVEGETIDEIKSEATFQEQIRGLDPDKNNIWSEQLN